MYAGVQVRQSYYMYARVHPTKRGICLFWGSAPAPDAGAAAGSVEQAVEGVAAIRAAPEHHAGAARALAEEYFDSDRVLARLLDRVAG